MDIVIEIVNRNYDRSWHKSEILRKNRRKANALRITEVSAMAALGLMLIATAAVGLVQPVLAWSWAIILWCGSLFLAWKYFGRRIMKWFR